MTTAQLLAGTSGIPTAPDAPTSYSIVQLNNHTYHTFVAPSNNGSPITSYEVLYSNGASATGLSPAPGSQVDNAVYGLWGTSNVGSTFSAQIRAVNAVGPGPYSAPSAAIAYGYAPVWLSGGVAFASSFGIVGIYASTWDLAGGALTQYTNTLYVNGVLTTSHSNTSLYGGTDSFSGIFPEGQLAFILVTATNSFGSMSYSSNTVTTI